MKRRILSIIMTFSMLMTLLPVFGTAASAEDVSLLADYPVAVVDGTEYYSFPAAWAKAVSTGGEIKLCTDWWAPNRNFSTYATGSEKDYFYKGSLYVPENKSVRIDLNGYEINRGLPHKYGYSPVSNGQVIYLAKGASLTIDDTGSGKGRIMYGNSSNGAGGIHAGPGSRIYMYGGAIAYCFSNWAGGGVYLDNDAMMFMYGGRIYRNIAGEKAYGGGGVYADSDSSFYMYGGSIYENEYEYVYSYDKYTAYRYGGGAIHGYYAYIELKNGVIKNNKASVGSAVHSRCSKWSLENMEITGNVGAGFYSGLNATRGAAIHMYYNTKCSIKNTSIHSNPGGGINGDWLDKFPNFHLDGEVKICNNLTDDGTARDVVLDSYGSDCQTNFVFGGDFKSTLKIGVFPYINYFFPETDNERCMSTDPNSVDYGRCFFSNDRMRKICSINGHLYLDKRGDTDVDPYLDSINEVKDKNGNSVKVENVTINRELRDVTFTVPYTVDISELAVSFNTDYTSSVEPDSSTYSDFTETAVYTLHSDRDVLASNWTVNIVPDEPGAYKVNVTNGTLFDGINMYKASSSVTAIADVIPNKRFVRWEASGVTLDDPSESAVTFTMPENAVSLTAVYEDLQSFINMEITPPSAGEALDTFATVTLEDGSKAEMPITWYPNTAKAQLGAEYTAVMSVSSEYGFASNFTASVNNSEADVKHINNCAIAVTKSFTAKDKLKFAAKPNVYFEHLNSVNDFVLPETVYIRTAGGSVSSAAATWNREGLSQYNSESGEQQCFEISGTITLPEGVEQNGISLNTSMTVYVAKSGTAAPVNTSIHNNGVYAENQTLTLSTNTEGADIYYQMTSDGSAPTEPTAEQKYTEPIVLTGIPGKRVTYKIKAVSAKEGMTASESKTYTFHIELPDQSAHTLKILDNNGNTAGLGGGTYYSGDIVTVKTADKSNMYKFKEWTVKEGSLTLTDMQKTSASFTFKMPDEDVTLQGEFIDAITNIKLDITAPQAGQSLDNSASYELYDNNSSGASKSTGELTNLWEPYDKTAGYYSIYTAVCTLKPDKANDIIFADSVTAEAEGASDVALNKNSDGSVTVYCTFPRTEKDKLVRFTAPTGVYYKPYGENYEVDDFLPNTVTIATENNSIDNAYVAWDSFTDPYFDEYDDEGKDFKEATAIGEIILPEEVENTDEIETSVEITVNVSNPFRSDLPAVDVKPGKYNENLTVALSVTDGNTIYYKINSGEEQKYTEPIAINGTAGDSVTVNIDAYTKNESDPYMSSGTARYTYTIELPTKETVTVINGVGSGEYEPGDVINIMAEPRYVTVFKSWKAESVYYTTEQKQETITDADGNEQTITVDVTIRHAEDISSIIADTSSDITTLTVPSLDEGRTLEVTAECLNAVTAVDLITTLPKAGEALPTEITTNADELTLSDFAVTPADTTAQYNTTYTMSVKASINEGYVLAENAVFNINGCTAAVTANEDGSYTVAYSIKTAVKEDFNGTDVTWTKKEYRIPGKSGFADSYYADISAERYIIPTALKWTVTNTDNEAAWVPFTAPAISGSGTMRFGFILTGTADELDTISNVGLDVDDEN